MAGHIRNSLVQLHIHEFKGLVHVVNGCGAKGNEFLALSPVGAQGLDFRSRAKRVAQQPARIQLPNPLAIPHIGLARRQAVRFACVHQGHC